MDREAWWAAVHVAAKSQTQTEHMNTHTHTPTPPRKHVYKSLHGHMLSFLLGKHLGVKGLD